MSATAALPRRMSLTHGGRAIAVAIVAEVTGSTAAPDHAIAIALISVVGGFLVMLTQLTVSDWLRGRRERNKPPPHPDAVEEQAELHDRYLARMLEMEDTIQSLRAENARLRRRK